MYSACEVTSSLLDTLIDHLTLLLKPLSEKLFNEYKIQFSIDDVNFTSSN